MFNLKQFAILCEVECRGQACLHMTETEHNSNEEVGKHCRRKQAKACFLKF
ncbi:MAG: hypothetical protein FWD49_02415 [Firmicutes bacterium]|nr:hypothetical protein [Bacillota bacterium]